MSDSVQPCRQQPIRLPRPWDCPGKNTGVGCHFLLQCMKVKSESEITQSCPTLSDPMDCSLPGSSVLWIFQTRMLEWVANSSSRGSSQPRDRTCISCKSPASLLHCRQILLLLSHSPKKWRLFFHYYLSFRLLGEPLIQTNIHISLIIISFLKLLYVNKDPNKFYTVSLVNMSL